MLRRTHDGRFTFKYFKENIRMARILKSFSYHFLFPKKEQVNSSLVLSHIFRTVIDEGRIAPIVSDEDDEAVEKATLLQECIEKGHLILSADRGDFSGDSATYIFPTQLQQMYVKWMFYGDLEPGVIRESKLIDFVTEVIARFSPASLSPYAEPGFHFPGLSGSYPVPKTQFRGEFYTRALNY